MQLQQVRRSLVVVLAALLAGALGGYLAGLVRPRPPRAYASSYTAPHPDVVALTLDPGVDPAVIRTPTRAPAAGSASQGRAAADGAGTP